MKQAIVNVNRRPAGILQETEQGAYIFKYIEDYLPDNEARPVSLTLPKREEPYQSSVLFPCFFNLLSEGANKAMQCRIQHIEPEDHFGLLLATAQHDCIGFLTVTPIES